MGQVVVDIEGMIHRPIAEVAAQFADFQYHSDRRVHPDLKFTVHEASAAQTKFRQEAVLLGMKQVDEVVNSVLPAWRMRTEVVDGTNKGFVIDFNFEKQGGHATRVKARFAMPVRGLKILLSPFLKFAIQQMAYKALEEDRKDLEAGNYEKYLKAMKA